jgi:hypothetical protein
MSEREREREREREMGGAGGGGERERERERESSHSTHFTIPRVLLARKAWSTAGDRRKQLPSLLRIYENEVTYVLV